VSAAIVTRHSTRLFTGHAHARGFDFLQQQVQSWHYGPGPATLEIDPYTPSDPSAEGATWKNLVLTIPGQVAPDDLVLLTAHFDSRASTTSEGQALAPGADDNGTGSSLLLEAARLLRQFRFERTIKIVWFTGEEQFLLGSKAYVADHPTGDVAGVVNVDMAGYDGDADRCFEIHVGTLAASDAVGQCFADITDAYNATLSYDYLTTNATDRSDHASFWNATPAAGAVEISENFFSDTSPGGCAGIDQNPHYHQTTDTTAFVNSAYGFLIARSAMATLAAMATPIGACFTASPVLTATPGDSSVGLSWSAVGGAASYRIYRTKQGCLGQWTEVGATAGMSWTDTTAVDPTTYSYHVEAVASDGFCVSRQSNCASALPTVRRATALDPLPADVCPAGGPGSGDGVLDPGETATLPVTLLNDGNTSLSSIAGVLSSAAPGLYDLDNAASWPNLPPTQSAQSLPDHFTVRLDDDAVCGETLDVDLALGYAQGGNVTDFSLSAGGTTPLILLGTAFSTGIPAGWSVVDGGAAGGTAASWTTANPGGRTIGSPLVVPFAIVDSDIAGPSATQDEQLVTPAVDLTNCRQVNLIFSNQFNYEPSPPYELADVDVSTNGGASWTNVLRLFAADDGHTTPNTTTVDVTSAIAADPSSVKARFRYHQGQDDGWWAIDNVRFQCIRPVCNACLTAAPGEAGVTAPLSVRRESGQLVLEWGASAPGCMAPGYAVYRGDLDTLRTTGYNHDTVLACGDPLTSLGIPETDPRLGSADYFLVVAGNGADEGSYGRASTGPERPPSGAACLVGQNLSACP
jgi:leucyl aminopeptidase